MKLSNVTAIGALAVLLTVAPGAAQTRTTAIANYTENGVDMAEWVTWVRSPKSHVFFFARTSLARFPLLYQHAEQVIASARIP